MLQHFRNSLLFRITACYLLICMAAEVITPTAAWALTSGPTTPEVQSFSPVGATELVNVATGDFGYDIPLLDVEGYPVNLSYSSSVSPDDEASMVGLGWHLNAGGHIIRNVRGLPDDFKGDEIQKETNMRPYETWGLNAGIGFQLAGIGISGLGLNLGYFHNNYNGPGFELSANVMLDASKNGKTGNTARLGLGFSANSQTGSSLSTSLSYSEAIENSDKSTNGDFKNTRFTTGVGTGISSRAGLTYLSFSYGMEGLHTVKTKVGTKDIKTESNGGGSFHTFAAPSYTPQLTLPFSTYAVTLSATAGLELPAWAHPNMTFSGYYSRQDLKTQNASTAAYGYLYAEDGQPLTDALMDFNREKDASFIKGGTQLLPLSSMTYDTYTLGGQGVGGMVRPYRGDIGYVYDPEVKNTSNSASIGAEFGVGWVTHGGLDASFVNVTSKSGKWTKKNDLISPLRYRGTDEVSSREFEPHYFKLIGEKAVESDPAFATALGEDLPVRVNISQNRAYNQFTDKYGNPYTSSAYHRTQRNRRNQVISYLTAEEASRFGHEAFIRSYSFDSNHDAIPYDANGQLAYLEFDRVENDRPAHSISEITVLQPNGTRYVYGMPVLNKRKREVTFNASGLSPDCQTNQVTYTPGQDNSIQNERGLDHYFNAQETPAYWYTNMLTGMLGPDYVDVGQDGITDDDLGLYYKFNYHIHEEDFKWRAPIEPNSAAHSPGFQAKSQDDKASYSYGEKQIAYPHSIESPNYVLEFHYSEREDGLGVDGENGGVDPDATLLRLDRIVMYAKEDRIDNGPAAEPIKTVVFHYEDDDPLCVGVVNRQNTNKGKLTLKGVSFEFGDSKRAAYSGYEFFYAHANPDGTSGMDPVYNPEYNPKAYDKWGNYQPHTCGSGDLPSWIFPYTNQEVLSSGDPGYDVNDPDRRFADIYSQSWLMTAIKTPTGGLIEVEYESKDYAYVQDFKAGQMFKVLGASTGPNVNYGSSLISRSGRDFTNHNYLIVDLPYAVNSDPEFKKYYLAEKNGKQLQELYFNFEIDINGQGVRERVPGYVEIEDAGVVSGTTDKGWIQIKEVGIRDNGSGVKVNPISAASWNYSRLHLREWVYPGSQPNATGQSALLGLGGALAEITTMFENVNRTFRRKDYSLTFTPAKSWVRLSNPDGFKHGGGARVKKIVMHDNWADMTQNQASSHTYGQTYDYTIEERGRTISSGVAAYEPMIGGDEISLRKPIVQRKRNMLFADDMFLMESPVGESFYPGPSIIYRQVKVQGLTDPDINAHATGYTVQQFYTAKDFPVKVDQTTLYPKASTPNPILKWAQLFSIDNFTGSQGYSIIRNDMHGKPKASWTYAEGRSEPIAGMEYFYRTEKTFKEGEANYLTNEAEVIMHDGTTTTADIGVERESVVDVREHKSQTMGLTLQGNFDMFLAFVIPLPLAIIIPTPIIENTRFRSIVTTKVVDRYGILDKTVVHEDGAQISTQNLLWDGETGEVLLTQTTNEYQDDVFSFTYPAHWPYDEGMGQAYKNVGKSFLNISLNNFSGNSQHFLVGDEVMLFERGTGGALIQADKGWVMGTGGSSLSLIDKDGNLIPSTAANGTPYDEVKILRSGRRNQQSVPVGSIVSKENPLSGGLGTVDQVVSAGSMEFSDERQTVSCCPGNPTQGNLVNPYLMGLRGVHYPLKEYGYLTDRTPLTYSVGMGTDIRRDGVYTLSPFWSPGTWSANPAQWTSTEEVSIMLADGIEAESMNALGVYSSAQFGYAARKSPMAVTGNAQLREMGNANFEYEPDVDHACEAHLGVEGIYRDRSSPLIFTDVAHSGYKAIRLRKRKSGTAFYGLKIQGEITTPIPCVPQSGDGYPLSDCDCTGSFAPSPGKKYVFSYWVQDNLYNTTTRLMFDYSAIRAEIKIGGVALSSAQMEVTHSKIIEGWQLHEYVFEIPASATGLLEVEVENTGQTHVNVDDIRIHPFNAVMQTYVYDPVSLLLLGQGDEQGYFTFYQYDNRKALTSVKKETVRGIKSLQEVRANVSRK